MRILLVDDEPTLLNLLRRALEREGHSVTAHGSAEAAMEALRDGSPAPEVLITDQVLPGAGGLELAAMLLGTEPAMRAIVCSGFDVECGAVGAGLRERIRLLQKPFQIEDLLALLA